MKTTPEECFRDAMVGLQEAIAALEGDLALVKAELAWQLAQIDAGANGGDIVEEARVRHGAAELRRSFNERIRELDHCLQQNRAISTWLFIEHHGLTFAEAGRIMGVSPQMVRRIHRVAEEMLGKA